MLINAVVVAPLNRAHQRKRSQHLEFDIMFRGKVSSSSPYSLVPLAHGFRAMLLLTEALLEDEQRKSQGANPPRRYHDI